MYPYVHIKNLQCFLIRSLGTANKKFIKVCAEDNVTLKIIITLVSKGFAFMPHTTHSTFPQITSATFNSTANIAFTPCSSKQTTKVDNNDKGWKQWYKNNTHTYVHQPRGIINVLQKITKVS